MSDARHKPKAGCPICGQPPDAAFAPFCSARCKQVDLGRWLNEVYIVPGEDGPANSDAPDDDGEAG